MISPQAILALGTALAAVGVWWLLPGSGLRRRALGGVLALAGFGCLGSQVPAVGDCFTKGTFHAIAAATIVAAVATISFRSPVYCAIWFGMTLTGTAGLFLMAGAEFLAVATIVVYAGAILVTFLFVLMLSQPEGHTSYDRRSREPMISAFTGAVLVGILTAMIGSAVTTKTKEVQILPSPYYDQGSLYFPPGAQFPLSKGASNNPHPSPLPACHKRQAGEEDHASNNPCANPIPHAAPPTISRLGAVLFTRYLVAVEAAGALLFAALVGAAVIVTQGRAAMKQPAGAPGAPGHTEGGTAHGP